MMINPFIFNNVLAGMGYLYNFYAASDSNFAPTDWGIPTEAEFDTLIAFAGGTALGGGRLKETGTVHWNSPNTGASNSKAFTARGAGSRNGTTGVRSGFKDNALFMLTDYATVPGDSGYGFLSSTSASVVNANGLGDKGGTSVRLIYKGAGTPSSTVEDYDGNIYKVVKIGTQYWTQENWKCTHLNNGTALTQVEDDTTWSSATSSDLYYCYASEYGQLLENLVSVWEFDETSGTETEDYYGSNPGTISGPTINQTGKIGQSYQFTNDTDRVNFGQVNEIFDGTKTQLSVSMWFQTTDLTNNNMLIAKFYAGYDYSLYISAFSAGEIRVFTGRTETLSTYQYWVTTGGIITTGVWYHMVVTIDLTTDVAEVYINDTKYSTTLTQQANIDVFEDRTADLCISYSRATSGSPNSGLKGYIDQTMIWDKVLTSDEASQLYNGGNGVPWSTIEQSI